jgi:hypothetical protein
MTETRDSGSGKASEDRQRKKETSGERKRRRNLKEK